MKNIFKTLALFVVTLLSTTPIFAQDFQDNLDPVFLSKNKKIASYQHVNKTLIEKGTFSFRDEIKTAKELKAYVYFSVEKEADAIPTTVYLKTLRKAGNSSENPREFHLYLVKNIEPFKISKQEEAKLVKLYEIVRANTFEGNLDKVGAALTWLK